MSDDDRPGPTAPDPTERFDDPVEELVDVPEVEEPSVENPADRLPDPHEVDGEVNRQFWTAVFWMDVALAGVTLGPAYAIIRGGTTVGAVATVVGLVAAFRVYQTYRVFQNRDTDDTGGTDDTDGDEPVPASED